MNSYIVFIEINPFFEDAFFAAQELGYKIIYCSMNTHNNEFVRNKVDHFIEVHKMTKQEILAKIVAQNIDPRAVALYYSLKDFYIPLCGQLNQGLNNKFYDPKLIELTKDKIKMRRALADLECNPDYQIIDSDELIKETPKVKFPLIVKPPLGFSSIGVQKVNHQNELYPALTNCLSTYGKIEKAVGIKITNEILIEKFVVGTEVSVEVFANNSELQVLGICSKSEMIPPFFEEISYQLPANIPVEDSFRITKSAVDVCKKLNLKNGMAHLEFVYNANEIAVLDIGLRLGGGGLTHDLIKISYGINLIKFVFMNLLNINFIFPIEKIKQNTALLYLHQVERGGKISKVTTNCTLIQKCPEYKKMHVFVNAGDILTSYPQYSGLPGYTLFEIKEQSPASFSRAQELINNSLNNLRIIYEK